MLTEKKIIASIEVLELGQIQVKERLIIEKDGVQIANTNHRFSLVPGDNIEELDQRIKDIANTVWTQEVIDNYKSFLNSVRS